MSTAAAFCLSLMLASLAPADPPPGREAAAASSQTCDFVFIISVDGLRSDAITSGGPQRLPNLHRLFRGSATLNARTDPDFTITLPNHTSMITGRPVHGPDGHEWTGNTNPPRGATIQGHAHKPIASVFDVAHEHGVPTGCFYGKTKFSLWVTSFNTGRDLPDVAISDAAMCSTITEVTDHAIASLELWRRGLVFLHYADTDLVGHAKGWIVQPDSRYMQTVAAVDVEIGRIFAAIDADAAHRRFGIVLTTDHGGGSPLTTHLDETAPINYTIPLLVWVGDDAPTGDLYEINASVRHDPGAGRLPLAEIGNEISEHAQPIRNGEAGNLALSLLGLPAIPGSTLDAHQDLRILWPEPVHATADREAPIGATSEQK